MDNAKQNGSRAKFAFLTDGYMTVTSSSLHKISIILYSSCVYSHIALPMEYKEMTNLVLSNQPEPEVLKRRLNTIMQRNANENTAGLRRISKRFDQPKIERLET